MRLASFPRAVLFVPILLLVVTFPTFSRAADSKAPPRLVAKAPPPAAPSVPQAPTADTSASKEKPVQQIAQADLIGAGLTAADLIDMAQEYTWQEDWQQARQCLQAAAAIDPVSPEAAIALALEAETYAREGNQAQADLLLSQARAACSEAEVAAFCDAVQAWDQGLTSGPSASLEQALSLTAQQWKGTFTGGWAALRLAEHYIHLSDLDKAVAVCQATAGDYKTGPIAEEALVLLAGTVGWVQGNYPDAIALYQRAFEQVKNPRLRLRALVYTADCYMSMGDSSTAFALIQSIETDYGGRPGLPWARIYRVKAGRGIGRWDVIVDDAHAFLATTSQEVGHRNVAHRSLGDFLFIQGRFADAEAEFSAMVSSPQGTWGIAEGYTSLAECRLARGDLAGALSTYLEAADIGVTGDDKARYLYGAARVAERMGDTAAWNGIVARMTSEIPGSGYTARLAGQTLLPEPGVQGGGQ
jgi:tetratricopeptide (TPR) repeat protein